MIRVTIRTGEMKDRFLQRFKRICFKEGVIKEIKKRSYYEKPSDKRRRREKEQLRALRKRARGFRPRSVEAPGVSRPPGALTPPTASRPPSAPRPPRAKD